MRDINIKISKKDFIVFCVLIVLLIGVGAVFAVWNDNKVIFHDANDIKVYFNGKNRSLNEALLMIESDGCFGGTYVSDWKAITPGESVTFDHDLGTDAISVYIQFKPTLAGTIRGSHESNFAASGYGIATYEISSTQIKVSGGEGSIEFFMSDGRTESFPNGFVRVIAFAT